MDVQSGFKHLATCMQQYEFTPRQNSTRATVASGFGLQVVVLAIIVGEGGDVGAGNLIAADAGSIGSINSIGSIGGRRSQQVTIADVVKVVQEIKDGSTCCILMHAIFRMRHLMALEENLLMSVVCCSFHVLMYDFHFV